MFDKMLKILFFNKSGGEHYGFDFMPEVQQEGGVF